MTKYSKQHAANIFEALKLKDDDTIPVIHLDNGAITAAPDIPMADFQQNPELFIEKGCLDICKKLWELNIPTRESEAHSGHSFVVLDKLNEPNTALFETLATTQPNNYLIAQPEIAKNGHYGKMEIPPNMKYACFKFREKIYIIYDTSSSVLDTSLVDSFEHQNKKCNTIFSSQESKSKHCD